MEGGGQKQLPLSRLTPLHCLNLAHVTESDRIHLHRIADFLLPSFLPLPAGRATPQALPPEAVRASLAAISERLPVSETGVRRPALPGHFAAAGLKRLEKSVYTQPHNHTLGIEVSLILCQRFKHTFSLISPRTQLDLWCPNL